VDAGPLIVPMPHVRQVLLCPRCCALHAWLCTHLVVHAAHMALASHISKVSNAAFSLQERRRPGCRAAHCADASCATGAALPPT
jgi:hypothetical protein